MRALGHGGRERRALGTCPGGTTSNMFAYYARADDAASILLGVLGMVLGDLAARAFRLPVAQRRAVSLETVLSAATRARGCSARIVRLAEAARHSESGT